MALAVCTVQTGLLYVLCSYVLLYCLCVLWASLQLVAGIFVLLYFLHTANEMGGACSMYGKRRGVYRVLVGKPGGKRPLGRPKRRWEDNIMMDLQEVGCGGDGLD